MMPQQHNTAPDPSASPPWSSLVPKSEPPDQVQPPFFDCSLSLGAVLRPPSFDSGVGSSASRSDSDDGHSPGTAAADGFTAGDCWTLAVAPKEDQGRAQAQKGPPPKRRQQMMSCAVCADTATGFHYGVSSCNGCKTFFRRTTMSGRKFVCKHGGNCQLDRNGRCACRACRFQRCVDAGMDESAIQPTPSANLTLSIARKRFQRLQSDSKRVSRAPAVEPELFRGFEAQLLASIGDALRLEEKLNRLRLSTFIPQHGDTRIYEAVALPSTFADSDKYPLVQTWPRRPACGEVPQTEWPRLGVKFWLYLDLFLGMECLKTMDFFWDMSTEERVALTKSVVVPNAWLTSAQYSLSVRSELVQYPDNLVLFLSRIDQTTPLERRLMKGAIPALQRLKPDPVQLALIRSILLLNENCDGLSPASRDRVGRMRSRLTRVLLVYLQNRYGQEQGVRHWTDSLHFITALFHLQQHQYNYFVFRCYVLQRASRIPLFRDFLDPNEQTSPR